MSTLTIQLFSSGILLETVYLPAEIVMEMTLTITPNWVGLPKLISIVNIIEKINDAGFELISEEEVDKIAELITHYYLPTPMNSWKDRDLKLEARRIPASSAELYQEVSYTRTKIKNTVRDVLWHDSEKDPSFATQAQDQLCEDLKNRVKTKPVWRTKVLDLLLKAAVTSLFDSFVGFPLHTLVAGVLGGIFSFHHRS
jgi:hypothetical protein